MTASMGSRPRPSEREVVAIVARYLEGRGFRIYVDPDRTDYFDLVARRGNEVGLVEAKVADARKVLSQALHRRVWGDWTAVALAGERAARRLAERTGDTRASPVGIWFVRGETIEEVRSAVPWVREGSSDPYRGLRARFRAILDAVDRGEIPDTVRWDGVPGAVRRASHGRGFAEWRLDEPAPDDP